MIVIAQSRLFIFHFARMRFFSRILDAFAVVPGCNAFSNSFRSMKHVTKKRDNYFITLFIHVRIIFIRSDLRERFEIFRGDQHMHRALFTSDFL